MMCRAVSEVEYSRLRASIRCCASASRASIVSCSNNNAASLRSGLNCYMLKCNSRLNNDTTPYSKLLLWNTHNVVFPANLCGQVFSGVQYCLKVVATEANAVSFTHTAHVDNSILFYSLYHRATSLHPDLHLCSEVPKARLSENFSPAFHITMGAGGGEGQGRTKGIWK